MKMLLEAENIVVAEVFSANHLSFAGADTGFFIEVLPQSTSTARNLLFEHGFMKYLIQDKSTS